MAILLDEPDAERCMAALELQTHVSISAGTLAEAMIVAGRRNIGAEMYDLVEELGFEVVSLTAAGATKVAEAYARWGEGIHAASLNFGDCFAYALSRELGRPLRFVGDDFTKTDIQAA